MKKKAEGILLMLIFLISLGLISFVSACVYDSDCGTRSSEKYCHGNDVWFKVIIPFCAYRVVNGSNYSYCNSRIEYSFSKSCEDYCKEGECVKSPCEAGWICTETGFKQYIYSDCRRSPVTPCPNGCSNGKCADGNVSNVSAVREAEIACYNDSDCRKEERYCGDDPWGLSRCIKTYHSVCNNPGTPEAYCDYRGSMTSCSYCPQGTSCENGECVQSNITIIPICNDSDKTQEFPDGINYYLKGIAEITHPYFIERVKEDYCSEDWPSNITSNVLNEFFCNGSELGHKQYNCGEEGKICENGRCVEAEKFCRDSDGDNILIKGHLYSDVRGVIMNDVNRSLADIEDFCTPFGKYYVDYLVEFTCNAPSVHTSSSIQYNNVFVNYIECENGCVDGKCVEESACGNGRVEGNESCDGSELGGKTCQDFGFDEGNLSCCSGCKNFGFSGCYNTTKTCNDGDGNLTLERSYYVASGVSVGGTTIYGMSCPGLSSPGGVGWGGFSEDRCEGNILIERICNGTEAGSVEYNCPGICVEGACMFPANITWNNTCGDGKCGESKELSVGGNLGWKNISVDGKYYVIGVASERSITEEYAEIFVNGEKGKIGLKEIGIVNGLFIEVANIRGEDSYNSTIYIADLILGETERSCLEDCSKRCTDSDGGRNYFEKGETCIGERCQKDNCYNSYLNDSYVGFRLTEYFCADNNLESESISCENGCENGACVKEEKCEPVGLREDGKYCSIDGLWEEQIVEGDCENNFECKSNLCVGGKCVDQDLLTRIITFLRRWFGHRR